MSDYWKMMMGAGAKHKKKPEEVRELSQVEPIEVTPEVMGPVHDARPPRHLASLDEMSALDMNSMRRLSEAARTGETIIEMRECVARTDGRIKARSVEVSISFGERLSLGELLKGCLSMMDYQRAVARRPFALPAMTMPVPPPGRSVEPLDSPFRVLDAPPKRGLGYKKA